MSKLLEYWDLTTKYRRKNPGTFAITAEKIGVWVQYLAIVLGIIVQKYWSAYRLTNKWEFDGFWGWLLFAIITAIVIFPGVYKNSMDPTQPWFVQFCVIFTTGMGWQAIVNNVLPKPDTGGP